MNSRPLSHPTAGERAMPRPQLAIVDANRLSCIGLSSLLQGVIPTADISIFDTMEHLVVSRPDRFMHYFVSSAIYFEHAAYFLAQPHRTIVMVHGEGYPHLAGLLTLNVCQDEKHLAHDILALRHRGHAYGQMASTPKQPTLLTGRETEVAVLLAKGYINKEIGERLCISLSTVITHRKNIMEKLRARSLADIIIYVVTSGLVTLEEL